MEDSRHDVWQLLDTIRSLTEAAHWQLTRGDATATTMSSTAHHSLVGLSYAAHKFTCELQERMQELCKSGAPLPPRKPSNDDGTVQEGPTIYRIK